MIKASGFLFLLTFAAYLVSAFLYIGRITLRRRKAAQASLANVAGAEQVAAAAMAVEPRDAKRLALADRFGTLGFWLATAGVVMHATAMALRWIGSGHAPVTN
ncbi:MAG: hypothetical protein ACM3XM_18475, partial [Mycobacterium leprae]